MQLWRRAAGFPCGSEYERSKAAKAKRSSRAPYLRGRIIMELHGHVYQTCRVELLYACGRARHLRAAGAGAGAGQLSRPSQPGHVAQRSGRYDDIPAVYVRGAPDHRGQRHRAAIHGLHLRDPVYAALQKAAAAQIRARRGVFCHAGRVPVLCRRPGGRAAAGQHPGPVQRRYLCDDVPCQPLFGQRPAGQRVLWHAGRRALCAVGLL